MLRIPPELCTRCKGYKRLCGLPLCPLITRFKAGVRASLKINSNIVSGSTPPTGIIGEKNYPYIRAVIGIPPEVRDVEASYYDAPELWWGKASLKDIIELRSSMVSAVLRVSANDPLTLYEKEISLAAISFKPVDSEAKLIKKPEPKLIFNPYIPPTSLSAPADTVKINSSPKISRVMEKVIGDDLSASESIWKLYRNNVSIYIIQRALSFGLLGRSRKRKLVPTRWAITAVDSILASKMIKEIRRMKILNEYQLYQVSYLGNTFYILLYPKEYSFEWIEIWHPSTIFTKNADTPIVIDNRESWKGEALYMDGGYQAARLAILENLYRVYKRQAGVLIVREITPEYYASVGNWHIRESVRRISLQKPIRFDSLNEALNYIGSRIKIDLNNRYENPLLKFESRNRNRKLDEYM